MNLDPQSWPEHGRVGSCRAGHFAGAFVFVALGTQDRSGEDVFWQAVFRWPGRPLGLLDEIFVDDRSGEMQKALDEYDVTWAPAGVDDIAEAALFGFRADRRDRGASMFLDYVRPSGTVPQLPTAVDPLDPWGWVSERPQLS